MITLLCGDSSKNKNTSLTKIEKAQKHFYVIELVLVLFLTQPLIFP